MLSEKRLRNLSVWSDEVESDTWLMFLDSSKLYHSQRIPQLRAVLRDKKVHRDKLPLHFVGKLLIDQKLNFSEETPLDRLVGGIASSYDKWKGDRELQDLVYWANRENWNKVCAGDYSEYAIHSSILQHLMECTASSIVSHPFCGRRLEAMLDMKFVMLIGL